MNLNTSVSENVSVVAVIDPDAYAASTVTTGWIDMSKYEQLMAILLAGDIVSTGTIDAKFQQATAAAGTGAKDVTGTAITQLTEAGTDSNKQVQINLRRGDLDTANNFTHVRLSCTLATAGADFGAVVLAMGARYGTGADNDAATVDETVN